jgi:hypothetical protein
VHMWLYTHYKVESNGKVITQEQVVLGDVSGELSGKEVTRLHDFGVPFDPGEGSNLNAFSNMVWWSTPYPTWWTAPFPTWPPILIATTSPSAS